MPQTTVDLPLTETQRFQELKSPFPVFAGKQALDYYPLYFGQNSVQLKRLNKSTINPGEKNYRLFCYVNPHSVGYKAKMKKRSFVSWSVLATLLKGEQTFLKNLDPRIKRLETRRVVAQHCSSKVIQTYGAERSATGTWFPKNYIHHEYGESRGYLPWTLLFVSLRKKRKAKLKKPTKK